MWGSGGGGRGGGGRGGGGRGGGREGWGGGRGGGGGGGGAGRPVGRPVGSRGAQQRRRTAAAKLPVARLLPVGFPSPASAAARTGLEAQVLHGPDKPAGAAGRGAGCVDAGATRGLPSPRGHRRPARTARAPTGHGPASARRARARPSRFAHLGSRLSASTRLGAATSTVAISAPRSTCTAFTWSSTRSASATRELLGGGGGGRGRGGRDGGTGSYLAVAAATAAAAAGRSGAAASAGGQGGPRAVRTCSRRRSCPTP
jgi:hypothetical protein